MFCYRVCAGSCSTSYSLFISEYFCICGFFAIWLCFTSWFWWRYRTQTLHPQCDSVALIAGSIFIFLTWLNIEQSHSTGTSEMRMEFLILFYFFIKWDVYIFKWHCYLDFFFWLKYKHKYVLCGMFPLPWLTEMKAFCWVYCSTFELSAQIRQVQQVTSHM